MTAILGEVRDLGLVRIRGRRRGQSGLVVSIDVPVDGSWFETVKIDAFGQAHWHLYSRFQGERVHRLDGTGTLRGGEAVLSRLPELLASAGFPECARRLEEADVSLRFGLALSEVIGPIADSSS